MLDDNLYNFLQDLNFYIYSVIRIYSFIMTVSVLNNRIISYKTKFLFSILTSFILKSGQFSEDIVFFSLKSFLIILEQIVIGMMISHVLNLIFSVSKIAGEIISIQMGLSFSAMFDFNSNLNSLVISRFMNLFTSFLFFSFNGHIIIINLIVKSFQFFPIQNIFFSKRIFFNLVVFFNAILLESLMFIFPIVICLLLVNIIISILNRICYQLSVFSIGIPIILLVGILMIYYIVSIMSFKFNEYFFNLLNQL
ncbi:flagellar biosynthetic protein FliR [Buchnera aphidicola (Mindarus keteleerifoliae)]|uniref:flagellar biosynthetic protein FliR n=1 Tax=Buchnera aphidicola TaxID=9 RepID=UPI0031B6D7D6